MYLIGEYKMLGTSLKGKILRVCVVTIQRELSTCVFPVRSKTPRDSWRVEVPTSSHEKNPHFGGETNLGKFLTSISVSVDHNKTRNTKISYHNILINYPL